MAANDPSASRDGGVMKVAVGLAASGPPSAASADAGKSARQLEIERLRNSVYGVAPPRADRPPAVASHGAGGVDGRREEESRRAASSASDAQAKVNVRPSASFEEEEKHRGAARRDATSASASGHSDDARSNQVDAESDDVDTSSLAASDDNGDDGAGGSGNDSDGSDRLQEGGRASSRQDAGNGGGGGDDDDFDEAELEEALRNLDDKDRRILGLMAQLEEVRVPLATTPVEQQHVVVCAMFSPAAAVSLLVVVAPGPWRHTHGTAKPFS